MKVCGEIYPDSYRDESNIITAAMGNAGFSIISGLKAQRYDNPVNNLRSFYLNLFKKYISDFYKLPFGAIIGQATITDVIRIENLEMTDEIINRLTMGEKALGDYSEGKYAWILEDYKQFNRPIPDRGTLSIWEYPDENFKTDI